MAVIKLARDYCSRLQTAGCRQNKGEGSRGENNQNYEKQISMEFTISTFINSIM